MIATFGALLIVDDDEANRYLLCRQLERRGFATVAAASGREALLLLQQQTFDLVLLDITMPEMSGLQVLTALRDTYTASQVPVIMVSAQHQSKTIVDALQLGANDYITKPIDFPVLMARVDAQLLRKRAEEALRESEERYALAMQGSNDGLWDWDVRLQQLYLSPRWKTMLGYDDNELTNSRETWRELVHPEDRDLLDQALTDHFQDKTATHFEHEHRIRKHDNTYCWVLSRGLAIRDAAGRVTRMAGSQTDITTRKTADGLTGLPNRLQFLERLGQTLTKSLRHHETLFAVLLLDLDRFKVINESLGHTAGDDLLMALAHRLEASLSSLPKSVQLGVPPTAARLGGDEFIILLDAIEHVSDATTVAEYVQQQFAAPFLIGDQEVFTTASVGIALSGTGYERPEDMVRDAETAMYRAKTRGRARYEVFDTPMYTRAVTLMQMENDLWRAVEREEFRVFYQPIICLDSGQTAGVEALVRWQHPQRGLLAPSEFITLAEDTGLIEPMGTWVLQEACRQLAQWQQQFPRPQPLFVSVNLSCKQLLHNGLLAHVGTILQDAELRLPPQTIHLEITESVLLEQSQAVTRMLTQLHELGVQLSLDDFGTGYASLSYLHNLPLHTLKIDRSFVSRMNTEKKQAEIVRTIVVLARNLGLDVVAEGVETPEHLAALRALQTHYGQGYLFAKPLPVEEATAFLAVARRW